jgi:ElaB/YqjD/DUF883 family membrane-anchored ribosome-binding protein
MKTKLILWGKTEQDLKVLVAIELLENENKVKSYIFTEDVATEDFYNLMLNEWRFDREVEFPPVFQTHETSLTASEDILPEGILVEKPELISRAKTEWHFVVLSKKLYDLYKDELENMKDHIAELTEFSSEKWDELRLFWDKVQNHVKEKNLFRNHVESLKRRTDELFNDLKNLKNKADNEIRENSEILFKNFNDILDDIDKKLEKGLGLQPLFREMKNIQNDFRDAELSKDHRRKLWNRIDKTFKIIKEKRFGAVNKEKSPLARTEKRLEGLMGAIGKMEESINRDKDDMNGHQQGIDQSMGQLESELRKARLMMIQERIDSKAEKLKDMYETKSMLESRIEMEKKKEGERMKYERAKKDAEETMKEKVKVSSDFLKENESEILKATEKIKDTDSTIKEDIEEIVEKAENILENVVEQAADFAENILDKVKDKIEDVKKKFEEE